MPVELKRCVDCERVYGSERDLCSCGNMDFATITVPDA